MKYLQLFENFSKEDFKVWDELFGILDWKFKSTKNGDMSLDGESTYNELKNKFHLKKFEQYLVESVAKDLKDYIEDEYKDDLKDEYGFYEIKVDDPEKIKKQLLKDFESGIMKIDVNGKKLIIFKNDAKFDCVMLYANVDKKMWKDILEQIDEDDLYEDPEGVEEYGLEKEPHITIIFGIHSDENDQEKIMKKLEDYKPIELKTGEVGMFETDKYDVIKIDVKPTKELLAYRKDLIENTKNTQTYDTYTPHMTIAYVKKGKGNKYIKKIKVEEMELEFDTIKYSDSNYKKKTIKLTQNKK
jgi:2'-5' RNA ligase